MWAQGLTIGVLIGAGILTHRARAEAAAHVRRIVYSGDRLVMLTNRSTEAR